MVVYLEPDASLGILALGWAGLGAGPPTTVIVRKTLHSVIFAGETLADVLHSQIQLSYQQSHGTATVVMREKPAAGAEGDTIEIWGGTVNRAGAGIFARRFSGTVVRFDTTSFGRSCGLICKDRLYPLERFIQPSATGLSIEDITGSATATATQIVKAVMDMVGIDYEAIQIYDTGRVLGAVAPEQFRWKHPVTARAYINDILDHATPGWVLFQSGDANIYMRQVFSRPRRAPDFALIEGYNVVGSTSGSRGTEDRLTGVHVIGYDKGKGDGPIAYDVPATNATDPQGELSSSKIETDDHAQEMGDYTLQESDRELARTHSCTTPSDAILGIGQTHILLLPRNEITEPGFCQTLTITIGENGFRQTPGHVAGGLPVPAEVPPIPF